MLKSKLSIMVMTLAVLAAAMFLPAPVSSGQGPISVVVSIHPVADLVKQVGRERVTVRTFLPPGASPHVFDPTAKQMVELSSARAFIKVGAGLEFWADRFVRAVDNRNLLVVDLSKDMQLIESGHDHGREGKGDHGRHGRTDPHFWLDPVMAQRIIDRIVTVLSDLDPAGREFYRKNGDAAKAGIAQLHQEMTERTGKFRIREYVTFHPAWNYFSQRYGLRIIGVIEESPGKEPTARHIARIVKDLKRLGARVVFAEPQFNPAVAEAIAREAGARVLFLDPIGGPNLPDRDTYVKLIRYNLSQMERAMK